MASEALPLPAQRGRPRLADVEGRPDYKHIAAFRNADATAWSESRGVLIRRVPPFSAANARLALAHAVLGTLRKRVEYPRKSENNDDEQRRSPQRPHFRLIYMV